MKLYDLIVYSLFLALFKVYIIPQPIQKGAKLILIILCAIYLLKKTNIQRHKNIVFAFSLIIVLSSIIGFYFKIISFSSVINGIIHSICIYLIYLLCEYSQKCNSMDVLVKKIFNINSLYCLLSIISIIKRGHSSNGTEITYIFGSKFMTTYFFIMWYALYRVINYEKIKYNIRSRIIYILLGMLNVFLCKWVYCSTTMLASILVLAEAFIPKDLGKKIYKSSTIMLCFFAAGFFPLMIEKILNNDIVQYLIVKVLHKSSNMTGRLRIFTMLPKVIRGNILIGYGYGNDAVAQIVGFGNAQNGLMQFIVDYGLIGLCLFVIIVGTAVHLKKYDNIKIDGIYIIIYVMIFCSLVEISYNYIFFLMLFVLNGYKKEIRRERRRRNIEKQIVG